MTDTCEHNDKKRFIIQLNKSLIETEFCMDCGESMNCLQRLKDLKAELERKMTKLTESELREIKSWSDYYMCEEGGKSDEVRVKKILKKIRSLNVKRR